MAPYREVRLLVPPELHTKLFLGVRAAVQTVDLSFRDGQSRHGGSYDASTELKLLSPSPCTAFLHRPASSTRKFNAEYVKSLAKMKQKLATQGQGASPASCHHIPRVPVQVQKKFLLMVNGKPESDSIQYAERFRPHTSYIVSRVLM